jgi:hypothetical protein
MNEEEKGANSISFLAVDSESSLGMAKMRGVYECSLLIY